MLKLSLVAAATAAALLQAPAAVAEGWGDAGRDTAIAACIDRNGYKPAKLSAAVEDGLSDYIVWVEDKDGDLWLCNANESGEIYANILLQGDLLGGEGAQLITYDQTPSSTAAGPAGRAEELCAAIGVHFGNLEIAATVDDALGDYLVWLKTAEGGYWMCNASADQKLYAFEWVEYPVDGSTAADITCCAINEERGA
jgi:hypothetical protein